MEAQNFERVSEKFKREIGEMEAGKEPNEYVMAFMKGIIEHLNKKNNE